MPNFATGLAHGLFGAINDQNQQAKEREDATRKNTLNLLGSMLDQVDDDSKPLLFQQMAEVAGLKGKHRGLWDELTGRGRNEVTDAINQKYGDVMGSLVGPGQMAKLRPHMEIQGTAGSTPVEGIGAIPNLVGGMSADQSQGKIGLRSALQDKMKEEAAKIKLQQTYLNQRLADREASVSQRQQELEDLRQANRKELEEQRAHLKGSGDVLKRASPLPTPPDALRPGEVLEFVPGVIVTQHSGDGKANQYFLRGFNLDHGTDFATWVAGMPANMPTHAQAASVISSVSLAKAFVPLFAGLLASRFGLGRTLLLGAGLCGLCMLILMALGVYRVEGISPAAFMVPGLTMAISSGVLEELMYRGALFRIVEEWLGTWLSLTVSALVFGLSHYAPVEGALRGSLAITIEAGLLLAAAYMVTRRLWICIGLHVAWNFAQSGVFSGTVSGAFSQPGLFKSTLEGPDFLTGGLFGLEASLIAVLVCAVAGLVMLMMAVRRGNIVPPAWHRAG